MNLTDALVIVRNCSLQSDQMKTKQGQAALKVVDKKLQSLFRKRAWRNATCGTPIHMGDEKFLYPIPPLSDDTHNVKAQGMARGDD